MNFRAIAPLLFLVVLLSSFTDQASNATFCYAPKAKLVGVYDRDSLLNDIPAYRQEMDSIIAQKRLMDTQRLLMYEELAKKRSDFFRDSATMSPVIKELKLREIDAIRMNIAQFSFYINQDLNSRVAANTSRFDDLLKSSAAAVAKSKGFEMVLDKKELIEYKKTNSPVKTKNVTNDMRVQLGINK
jgi:Skp family chaperone for outer membrane proteins